MTLNLDHLWLPFTANRQFKSAPRLLVSAKDMHYTSHDGRPILDATSGMWCVHAGHARKPIVEAIQRQASTLDYGPTFQMGHPIAFEAATELAQIAPPGLDRVFFTNSGSESVDTALKIALAYHRAQGEGQRQLFVSRERAYHGTNLGGTAIGGINANRRPFGEPALRVAHLPHTHHPEHNAFSKGQPSWGAHLADELETRIIALHDASNIAAVIVEPVAGSTGVLVPPQGYLERLRQICDKHRLLLIFDEVITGFGRAGESFAAQRFDVTPDLITCAKGLTNGAVPMGAVLVKREIHDALMNAPENTIEFFHGYTYSGHPLAAAAAKATLQLHRAEGLPERARTMESYFADAVHSLRGLPHVIDIRNFGLMAAVELEPIPGKPTARAFQAFLKSFEKGVLIRTTGDIIALSPPLIAEPRHIDEIIDAIRAVLTTRD
jgi:beta-alanine--pyruvate transaminase